MSSFFEKPGWCKTLPAFGTLHLVTARQRGN